MFVRSFPFRRGGVTPRGGTSPWKWIYTTGGVGLIPGAPGTYASAVVAVLWVLVPASWLSFFPVILLLVGLVGVVASERAIGELGLSDPPCVVIDEWLGQGVVLMAVPHNGVGALLAFLVFRVFDILKPPPIRWLEKAPGGFGIMLDDLGAGGMGFLVLFALRHVIPGFLGK